MFQSSVHNLTWNGGGILSFPDDLFGIFVIAKRNEFGMPPNGFYAAFGHHISQKCC
jgi:hypothetical protein